MNHFFKGLAGALSTVGAYLVYLLGGWDAALTVMFVLMGLDYATGLLTAFMGKSPKTQGGGFRSSVAFIGISKKLMMVAIVMLAAALDRLTGDSNICRQRGHWLLRGQRGLIHHGKRRRAGRAAAQGAQGRDGAPGRKIIFKRA